MTQPADPDLVAATGLALALVASLIERGEPVPSGEVGRCLALIADAASPNALGQKAILEGWATLMGGGVGRIGH